MNILPSPIKFQPSPKLDIAILDSFVVSVLTSMPPQRATLPPPSFIPNSITVILSTTTYLSLRLPTSNWFRTLSPVQLLKLINPVTFIHITPVLRSLHWLKITERIVHRIQTTFTHLQSFHNHQPPHLHHLISVQPPRSTRSSSLVTLARPPTSSSLRITDRSFRYASLCLWNQLSSSLRQPHSRPSVSVLPVHAPTTYSHSVNSPLSPSITPSLFHSLFKTYLFHKYFPAYTPFQPQYWLHGHYDRTVSSEHLRFFVFSFFITRFCLVPCGRLSWLLVSFKWAHVNIVHRIVLYSLATTTASWVAIIKSTKLSVYTVTFAFYWKWKTEYGHHFAFYLVSDIAIFVLKRDVKVQLTNFILHLDVSLERNMLWPYVRLSVRPSVKSRYCTKMDKRMTTQTTSHDNPGTLGFWRHAHLGNSYESSQTGAPNTCGVGKVMAHYVYPSSTPKYRY